MLCLQTHLYFVNHKVVPQLDKASTYKKAKDLFIDKVGDG